MIQEINLTFEGCGSVPWTRIAQDGLVTCDGGFQMMLFLVGVYLAYSTNVAKKCCKNTTIVLELFGRTLQTSGIGVREVIYSQT